MPVAKVLLVDDDDLMSTSVAAILEQEGFDVTIANDVPEALNYVNRETFDVLLSDLHMPGAGDGLTVVSAMRHSNPKAVTMLWSAFPEMNAAAHAILMQADEILVKPMDITTLVKIIKYRLIGGAPASRSVESVASILERSIESTVHAWLKRVEKEKDLMAVPMSADLRAGHLPHVIRDLINRLSSSRPLGSKELVSANAQEHGLLRRMQGYTGEMIVEESRMLQVSIFETLRDNLTTIDFSLLLDGVMIIADEVDSQLGQALKSYNTANAPESSPVWS